MHLYCIKCLMFAKNENIKLKREINEKIYLYCRCIDCGFKKLETFSGKEITYLLKVKTIYKTMLLHCLK